MEVAIVMFIELFCRDTVARGECCSIQKIIKFLKTKC